MRLRQWKAIGSWNFMTFAVTSLLVDWSDQPLRGLEDWHHRLNSVVFGSNRPSVLRYRRYRFVIFAAFCSSPQTVSSDTTATPTSSASASSLIVLVVFSITLPLGQQSAMVWIPSNNGPGHGFGTGAGPKLGSATHGVAAAVSGPSVDVTVSKLFLTISFRLQSSPQMSPTQGDTFGIGGRMGVFPGISVDIVDVVDGIFGTGGGGGGPLIGSSRLLQPHHWLQSVF